MTQKVKFKINGMHCNSCAILIEERLKSLAGIIKSKINYESGKGVIIYDENTTKESEIQDKIKSAGDYSVEKIEEEPEEIKNNPPSEKQNIVVGESKEVLKSLKIITSLVIISLGLNVFLTFTLLKQPLSKELLKGQTAQIQNLPSNPEPPSLPTEQPSTIQTFEITKDDHIRGDFDAPVTLVEFSDFECPFCARHYPTLSKILSDYEGKVRWVYKHFPLPFHPNAQKAAESSECAAEQGKFWEYHDKLFENLDTGYSTENFKNWAKELGLNNGEFNDCLDSDKYAKKVQADYQEGAEKGVNGTPATFVNGQLVSGALPYNTFAQIVDNLLKQD